MLSLKYYHYLGIVHEQHNIIVITMLNVVYWCAFLSSCDVWMLFSPFNNHRKSKRLLFQLIIDLFVFIQQIAAHSQKIIYKPRNETRLTLPRKVELFSRWNLIEFCSCTFFIKCHLNKMLMRNFFYFFLSICWIFFFFRKFYFKIFLNNEAFLEIVWF